MMDRTEQARLRAIMCDDLERDGIESQAVLDVMARIPRHDFVPAPQDEDAYEREPLPIGWGQTISAPYVVAFMTERLALNRETRVLEIGTGCGYQTAILAELALSVHTVEVVSELATIAKERLTTMGYSNIVFYEGDGRQGWPEGGTFDAIIGTAAPSRIPDSLLDQLAEGGRMIIPVGRSRQRLMSVTREKDKIQSRSLLDVRFVPMVDGSFPETQP